MISARCVSSHGPGSGFPCLVVWRSVHDATAVSLCLISGLLGSPSSSWVVGACWGASCVSSTQSSQGCSCWASSVDNSSSLLGIGTNSGATRSYLGGAVSGISTADAVGMAGGTSLLPTLGGIWMVVHRGSSASTTGLASAVGSGVDLLTGVLDDSRSLDRLGLGCDLCFEVALLVLDGCAP